MEQRHNMEINKLSEYICTYDNILGSKKNNNLYRLLLNNYFKFEESKIFKANETVINKEIRSTEVYNLGNINNNNNTEIHWANLFASCIMHYANVYSKTNNIDTSCKILDIQILKYAVGGFYKTHIDSGLASPRTLSFIYFVNDDYESGELIFELPKHSETLKVNIKKDRLIIWPSNFLYPHKVEPVTKGVKFSVVSWAL